MKHIFLSPKPFVLESGAVLPRLELVYHTFGTPAPDRGNVVWVCHALTANSDVADWWPGTVVPGGFLDPEEHFTVCVNIPGSHYGSTGPLSINPETGSPYYASFPALTMRDIVAALRLVADHLGLDTIDTLVGSSVGGFQALEWAVQQPERFRRLVLIATDAKASPWAIAVDETQRMAIKADPTWGQPSPRAAMDGMAAARAIGLLTYRGPEGYNLTQNDPPEGVPAAGHRACTYQRHQGDKICARFNAYSYVSILDAFDTHDVGAGRGGVEAALATLRMPALVVGITTDIIFTPPEMRRLAAMIPHARYAEIASPLGHDGFLVEHGQLNRIISLFFSETNSKPQQ